MIYLINDPLQGTACRQPLPLFFVGLHSLYSQHPDMMSHILPVFRAKLAAAYISPCRRTVDGLEESGTVVLDQKEQ